MDLQRLWRVLVYLARWLSGSHLREFFKKIFWCGPFLKSLLNLLQYCFCFFLCFGFFDPQACRILVSWPGIELTPCIGGEVLTTGQPGKSQEIIINIHIIDISYQCALRPVDWWKWKSLNCVWLFATPGTVACHDSLSMGFPRQNTRVGCHFPLQGIFPTQGLIQGPNSHFSAFWNPCLILPLDLRSTSRNRALLKGCEISVYFLLCEISFCF